MKLAISNIAWPTEAETAIADCLQELKMTGVEVAPTKIWPKPLQASDDEVRRYRQFWAQRGMHIVALQSLLYGRPDLTIFETQGQRQATLNYLDGIMRLAGLLGARVLIFGAPKNRQVKDLATDVAEEIALEFFHAVAERAMQYDVVFCIEPNPVHYECDYITTSLHGLTLVRQVNHPGFGLHLDAAGLTLSEENLEEALVNCSGAICHFHASEPYLGPLGMGGVDHTTLSALLKRIDYQNWVSVEMRQNADVDPIAELRRVVSFLQDTYSH